MSGDKFDQLYNALKADGAVSGTRENFKKYVYAPGKQGYQNRKQLYDALHADGAVSSGSYEEFAQRLGLHATRQQKQPKQQTGKPQTAAQMAMSQGYKSPQNWEKQKEDVDYLRGTQRIVNKPLKGAPKNASPFVQSLYEADDEKREMDNNFSANETHNKPWSTKSVLGYNRSVDELHAKDAADMIVNDEKRRRNQPIVKTETPADDYVVKTQGQLEDEAQQSAKQMIDSDMGDYLDKAIDNEFKAAHQRGLDVLAANGNGAVHGTGGADWWIGERAYQQQMDADKQLENIVGGIKKNVEAIFSNENVKQKVLDDAASLGVDPEYYIKNQLAPALIEKANDKFSKTQLARMMPQGASDYIAGGILDSMTGTILAGLASTKSQRQMQQQANAMTDEGENPNYKPGMGARVARGTLSFATDAMAFKGAGIGANAATEAVFGNAAKQAARMANANVARRVFTGIGRGVLHGGVTGFQYGAANAVVQNYSTGEDTSLGNTLKQAVIGGTSEAVSFAAMEGLGGAVGGFGHKIGLNGTEKGFLQKANKVGQKITYEALKTGMEGIGMATGGVASSYARHLMTGEDWQGFTVEGTLESCANAVAFKLMHAKDLFKREVDPKTGKQLGIGGSLAMKAASFLSSDAAKSQRFVFTDDEKRQLRVAGEDIDMPYTKNIFGLADKSKGTNPEDAERAEDGSDVLTYYQQIMQDPNVSWDAKAKFSTFVMGTMPESRPMYDHYTVGTENDFNAKGDAIVSYNTISEYAADGTLLSKRRYDTKDKRESIIYELSMKREGSRLQNAIALVAHNDKNSYELQNAFFAESMKNPKADVGTFVTDMGTEGSDVFRNFTNFVMNAENGKVMQTFDAIAKQNGMERKDLVKASNKDPMKRTDAEQNACIQLRHALEDVAFPRDKVHEEQSHLQGKDVAEDNGLGTEKPNGEAVKQELNNLSEAENELEQFMKDNDVFGQNFENLQKQGLTNPQIYGWMLDNGLTEEQLAPFAHYINANARVQGMQNATQQMIEQKVSAYVQDWSLHGTLNGQEAKGEQVVWVQDKSGRTLVVGSGEMAFDSTNGRAKEGVGDMLVCLDPNTGEMVYTKVDDVTFFQTQKPEDFGNEYRNKLQQINSQAYNEAAQEQAAKNANLASQDNTTKPKDDTTNTTYLDPETGKPLVKGESISAENNQSVQAKPIGKGVFGDIYDGFKGKVKEAFNFLTTHKGGDLLGVFHRDDLGDIDLVWGDESMGLSHILTKHVGEGKDFATPEEAFAAIERIINEGNIIQDNKNRYVISLDGFRVGIRKDYDGKAKKWVVTAIDYNRSKEEKGIATNPTSASHDVEGSELAAPNDSSAGKDTNNSSNGNGSEATLTFKDGNSVPMTTDSKGRPTPDYGKMTAEQAADVMTQQFGEDAEKVAGAQIKKAEKALKDAEKMKVDYNAEPNDILEQKRIKDGTIAAAKEQLQKAQDVKKALTAQKVAETVSKPIEPTVDEANQASPIVKEKFDKSKKVAGRKGSITLPNGTKIKGTYYYGETSGLTPSHDPFNDFKQSEGFPVNEDGTSSNSRSYKDKGARQFTIQIGNGFNGLALKNVPVVQEGITLSGSGTTMAKLLAERNGKDGQYREDLNDNIEGFGMTPEKIAEVGDKGIVYFVPDEKFPLTSKTFDMFNKRDTKSESNTEQAVAKAKTLTADEVGAIVADIEGNGSLDAFFNNSKAINDLVKTLVSKGVIGQNEVDGFMDGPERLSAQGKEYVKNLLLGSVFKPETIRMLGFDPKIKNAAINGIRSIMDNLKLGDYSLRDEIDQAVQLLYEARRSNSTVEDLLKQSSAFDENARDRFSQVAQAIAQALEGNTATFRDLMREYNDIAKSYNTGEADIFGEHLSPEELVKQFLEASKTIKNNDIKLYGNESRHSEQEGGNHAASNEEPAKEAGGTVGTEGSEPTESQERVNEALKHIATEITKQTGIEVVTDEKEAQKVLDEAENNGIEVKKQAMLSGLTKAAKAIKDWVKNGKRGKVFTIDLPSSTQAMIKKEMGRDFDSHNITANGIAHAKKNHGEDGKKLSGNSIPLRDEDFELLPYIMTAPDYVKEGSADVTGRRSVRFYKDLSNGYVVVAEKEYKNSPDDMETITMWAEMSDKATNAQRNAAPDTHVQNAILDIDAAKIRKDAETAIENDVKNYNDGEDNPVKFHKVTDKDELERLNNEETFTMYSGMQVIDNGLYSPMAAIIDGKRTDAVEMGDWHRADERPDLVNDDGTFTLVKTDKKKGAGEGDVDAAYNPYMHTSTSMMNDQFTGAYARGNIRVVEWAIPKSELESGYHAEKAKDAVGMVPWHSGSVNGLLPKDRQRSVMLSRWRKAIRVVPDAEVAEKVAKQLEGTDLAIPWNTFTPNQIREFTKLGVPITTKETGTVGKETKEAFLKQKAELEKEFPQAKFVDVKMTKDAYLKWGKNEDIKKAIKEQKKAERNAKKKAKEFRASNGEVYGFTVDGKIYLDTKKMKPETPLHEYTHLWTAALKRANPKEWENVKKLFDEVEGLKEEVSKLYPELKGDDLYEEMITTYSGREGAKKLEDVVRGLASKEGKTVEESSKAQGFLDKVKTALQKYWKGVADMLHIHFTSAEEVADKVLADWAKGVNPKDVKGEEKEELGGYFDDGSIDPQSHDWSKYKEGDIFDYEGYKSQFVRVERDENGKVTGVIVQHLDENGNPIPNGREDVPPLMFLKQYKPEPSKDPKNIEAEDVSEKPSVQERKQALLEKISSGTVKKKDAAWGMLAEAEELLAEHYGIPYDEYGGRTRTQGPTIDLILNHYVKNVLDKITDEPIPAATEKQMNYVMKLAEGDHLWKSALEGMILNKKQASWLIDAMKQLDVQHLRNMSYFQIEESCDEVQKGIDLVRKTNGAKAYDWEGMRLLPKEEKPDPKFNPIEAAAEDYKKEHPMTEEEIRNSAAFDDLPEDQKQYCIDAAIDYLNGEDTSSISEAYYRNAYEKRAKVEPKKEKTEVPVAPMEGFENTTDGHEETKKAKSATERVKEILQTPKGEKPKATSRKELEAERDAADNEFEAFMKELRKKRSEQLNSGFLDQNLIEAAPKMFSLAAKCAYSRIKLGMYDAKEVVKDLRSRFKEAFEGYDKRDVETFYSQIMNQKWRDGDKRMSLNDWAEHYRKLAPEHKENLEGDSKDAEDRKQNENTFINKVKVILSLGGFKNGIVGLRKIAESCGLKDAKDTDLQELAETAIVGKARDIAASGATSTEKKFEAIKNLYENQPSLNQRDSERVMKQQYSTPSPYAFLANMYVKGNGKEVKSALEPSAGNGMLTIGLPMDAVHVNDIDAQRLANLRRQGFKNVTSQDGTQPFADKDVDVVVTNPPFGSATPKEYDGYKISSLEGQMAINALESMKDDGRAAIIIGGKTEYATNGSLKPKDKAFLGYLYSHYNVEDVINVDGSLYAKQGTTYPTRIILINGRRLDENAFPPVKSKARAEAVKDYDELYKRINDDILQSERMDSSIGRGAGSARPELDKQRSNDSHNEGLRVGQPGGSERKASDGLGGVSGKTPVRVPDNELGDGRGAKRGADVELHNGAAGTDTTGTESTQSERRGDNSNRHGVGGSVHQPVGAGRNDTQRNANGPSGVLKPKPTQERSLSSEKVGYAPKSENPFTLQSVMPADQQEAVNKNLEKLGDADQFLVDELGYNDKDDLYSHLAAEQVDSVALALQQAKKGNAFIIGDMTGIGKGRQAASLIRYAKKQGQVSIYFTKTAGLLSDVYRDLVDIGSQDLRPFVFGSSNEAKITDSDGKVVFQLPTDAEKERVLAYIGKYGKLPKEYDYVLTTYSQVANGVYEFDENDNRKERKLKKGDKFGPSHFSGQARRDAIEKLISNGYLILDESHTAGGQSNQGNYFQHIIQKAKNVTFFSATFAKRPDNMPIYALRTAMNQGGLKASELIDAVKRGGATLQEIMSQTLTQCGQMIRRERDMTGVTIDWKPIDDPVVVAEHREQYDKTIELFNDIINFQKSYVIPYIEEYNGQLAAVQASMGLKRGTKALGIASTPFASKAFNTVQQVLLSLKAKEAAKRAIDYLNQGIKPVIALNNTNESQSGEIKENVEVEEPDLGTSLKKGLAGTLRYTKKDSKNKEVSGVIDIASLGDDAVNAYNGLMKKIENASTGLALSPIDVIKNELQKAGYKVGELTGRQSEFVYNDNGTVSKVKRTNTDKKKLAREFNDGGIDALILNKSASTGISLHASSKFKDQRKRVMIVAQQQLDVNDEVQMRGRIDRTGQVTRGAYEYIVSQIPAEQRLLMMFKAKLKSLDANTTSSQKSKFNEMEVADITNKYGDKICKEYMAEHLDLYSRMADPFGWESNGADLQSVDPQKLVNSKGGKDYEDGQLASKLLGRMALLKVEEQEVMLKEIGELYAAEIQRLNEMGENDLEITELPLKAKTIRKEIWKEGTEPGGDNAFADNTYIEKVNMAILKKPMKAEEVKRAQDGLTGGKDWEEYREAKKADVKSYFDQRIAEETQKNEERAVKVATKAKEKYLKDAKKGQKDSGMSDEQIEKMAGYQYDNIYNQEKEKLNDVVKNLKSRAGMFERVLDTFNTYDAYVLPVDMNNPKELSGFGNSYGRLVDVKITDNYSPNASSVSFATLDGRRKITFPITGKVGAGENKADVISAIAQMTRQASATGDKNLRVLSMDVNNWDRLTSNESRKDGYIITGNLMQALIDAKNQGVGGQLVKYTTDTGEVKTGILMPDRFKPTDVSNEYPISSVAEKFDLPLNYGGIEEVVSSDGSIRVISAFERGDFYYQLRVPKSKAKGGKFFLDKELLDMVRSHNFESRGNSMLANFDANQLRPVLARLSNLGVKVREERKSSEDSTHFRTADGAQGSDGQSIVSNHIANVAGKVGGKVNMVNSAEEVTNKRAKAAIEAGEPVTGWYDEETGEVHLYMPNIHDRYTAEKTIWHEVVGHKGMRELFGEDRFDKFLDSVWYDLDKPENASLKKLVMEEMQKNPFDYRNAIEEGVARLAEEGRGDAGFWRNIKNKVTDFLHEIGYRIAPNTKDVKYLLWLSKNLQKNPNDPYYKMRAEAVKYHIDHEDVPAVTERDGMFHDNTGHTYNDMSELPKAEYQEMTDGKVHFRTTPSAGTALDRYDRALNAHGYMATESFMDNMLSLKELMKAVDPTIKKIEDVKSSENPYILQNTMQGAMSNAAQMFERNVMKPLDRAMADVLDAFDGKKDEEKIRNFNLYMITKHGLERNRVFFVRDYITKLRADQKTVQDAEILQKQWDAEKKDLGDKLRNGSINLKKYYEEMDEWIRNSVDKDYKAEEHDYSGMHGLQGLKDNKAPYDDAAAIQSVMDSEANMESVKAGSVKNFWSKVNAATSYSLYCDYANGFQSRETYTKTSQMFDWYVPLRKFDEQTAEDVYGYVTEKGDPSGYIGSVLMSARGRKSLSEVNVLAQIGAMGNMAISNGGKNAIKQAFMRFARSHDSQGLITEGQVWLVKDGTNADGSDRWVEAYPQIPDGADPNTVSTIINTFEADMKAKQAKGDAKIVRNAADIGYKFERAKDKLQHVVDVKVNGKTCRFYINGNPRAAQALNGMLENKGTKYLKYVTSTTRIMAQLCTSYSPEFVVRNIVRDMQFASSNVTAKEGTKYGGRWGEYYAMMLPIGAKNISIGDIKGSTGLGLYAKYRNGTLDMNNTIHKYFKEFMENGGETGWVQVLSMKDWEKKYKRDIKTERSKLDKGGKAISDFFFGNLKNLNEAAENMARFATYCTSRDYGRSVVRSAYDAKEVSTNFNRHGSGDSVWSFKNGEMGGFEKARRGTYGFIASYLRQCSMFFNAGIQSTNLLKQNFKAAPKGTITAMMAMPFGLGIGAALLNNWMIDQEDEKDRNGVKDPYAELPDYIRRNSLCIYKGGGEFITIPLAIELRAFYGLGDLAIGMTFAKNIKSTREPWMDAVGCVSQLVPVMDYTNSHAVDKNPGKETLKALTPSAASPLVEWWLNSDWKGAPIRRETTSYNEYAPAWQRAYKNTPQMFMNLNKKVNAMTNDVAPGNEDMLGNGFLDAVTNPAALNHYLGGFGGGAATFSTRLAKLTMAALSKTDNKVETNDVPFLRSFLYKPNEQSSMQRTKSKWYNYVESMEKIMSNLDRLKSKNVPIDKRLENVGAYYKFKDSKEAQMADIIERAQKYMKKWKQMRDKSSDATAIDNANGNIDLIMQDAVERLDKLQ